MKFETIAKYNEWYLCPKSRTNHAIICLYYYPQKFCNFHMKVFQIKLKYYCSEPIKLVMMLQENLLKESEIFGVLNSAQKYSYLHDLASRLYRS